MRLLSYNILDGGTDRVPQLADVISTADADVVALVEADNHDVVTRLASRLGMDFIFAEGSEHSVALMSRWPIIDSINHTAIDANAGRCLLEATVVAPNGTECPIGVLHLRAHATEAAEHERCEQLNRIRHRFERHRRIGKPHVLCGDFNANAPTQQIDFDKASPRTQREAKENGGDVPRRAIAQMLAHGYTDTLRAFDASYADATGTFKTQYPQQRVDYIFAHSLPADRIVRAWIDNSDRARDASDHFPVGVELR
ncbi:MAG TPA: endonuclease/exonuclease/phosphatase family protein [Tepidisphaeraceae bacterium]|jgi:endonuclease/exonuclease/phosphatase family metal-dependent hydrolase|nr:endonuclease/exonuclease/phosphatase family protein [Tepidisphaeraceae bacterium]